jgi:hypothetical protein
MKKWRKLKVRHPEDENGCAVSWVIDMESRQITEEGRRGKVREENEETLCKIIDCFAASEYPHACYHLG